MNTFKRWLVMSLALAASGAMAATPAVGTTPATAAPSSTLPQLLSIQYLQDGPLTVSLPTVKTADGSVCTSYVASVTHDANGQTTGTLGQLCMPADQASPMVRPLSSTGPQLLSIQYLQDGPLTVALPTVQNTDGSVCTSYVAEARRTASGDVAATVRQACRTEHGQFVAIQNVEHDGLTVQTVTTQTK